MDTRESSFARSKRERHGFPGLPGASQVGPSVLLCKPMLSSAGSNTGPGAGQAQLRWRPGLRIGRYELIRELGRGGMGAVYLARDTKLGRRVAIKFLHSTQPELTVRFILEARATAQCHHENIVVIHEVDEHEASPYMVLEYLEGAPLSRELAHGKRLPPGRAIELMVPVVRALACAHERNIVHRDLKPDNIFVTNSGTVKVLDFGVAKLLHGPHQAQALMARLPDAVPDVLAAADEPADAELTQQGMLIGTLPYMSPEQWGAGTIDHRTDLWAVGIILYRMVVGWHPLAPREGKDLMVTAVLDEPMPGVRVACPSLPDELASVIDRCLIKPRDQRMGSARELLDALEPLLPGRYGRKLRADQSPYAGLSSFQEADADHFFGRTREIAAAVARLRDQPMLGVVGPSGVGKSSFVRAGVIPALKHSGEPWVAVVVRPGRQPVAALAHAVVPWVSQDSQNTGTITDELSEHQDVIARLHAEPGYLGALLRSAARRRGHKLVLFVDQLEELYTLVPDARERLAFTACLASVADDATSPLRVILSIRSDFLDRVAEDPHFLAELTHRPFFLTPPGRDDLRDALVQPAEMAGYRFESESMVENMLDHLEHTPDALPLLQFAATRLWDLRDAGHKLLTEASYHRIGGIAGALASHADAVLAELPARSEPLVRALLLRLVTPERTRAIVPLAELCERSRGLAHGLAHDPARDAAEVQHLVDHLAHARLLVIQTGDAAGSASVEIVHESLIQSWPLLSRWLDENQDDAAFLDQLRVAAKQWQARGYPDGLLWRGEAMEEARRWHRRYRGELPALQAEYLRAVLALAARAGRRRRYAVAGIMVLLAAIAAAASVALVLIREAQKQATAQAAQVEAQYAQLQTATSARERAERNQQAALEEMARAKRDLELSYHALERKSEEVAQAKRDLELSNDALESRNTELGEALERAREAREEAEQARLLAQSNEAAARAAEDKERRANTDLAAQIAREKARIARLEEQLGTSVIQDLDVD